MPPKMIIRVEVGPLAATHRPYIRFTSIAKLLRRRRAVRSSFHRVRPRQPDLLDVKAGLHLAQDDVVDALAVAQLEECLTTASDERQPQTRVLPVVLDHGIFVCAGGQEAALLLGLHPHSCDDPLTDAE